MAPYDRLRPGRHRPSGVLLQPDLLNVSETSAVAPSDPEFATPTLLKAGGRSVLVAATGGHLTQLLRLSERIDLLGDPLWVTFDSPQSRSLLAGHDHEFVDFIAPRQLRRVLATMPVARRLLRDHRAVEVISTGSAVALAFLPIARAMGIPAHYIESAARTHGPSVTGHVLRWSPGVRMYSQYPQRARGAWTFAGSQFEEFAPARIEPPTGPLTVMVMLGTLPFRFDAMIDAVRRTVPADWNIIWQTGPNTYTGLPGEAWGIVEAHKVESACRRADIVIAHAGVGSALTALAAGKHAVLLDRAPERGEHVDGHQRFIAEELQRLGLATHASPEGLDRSVLLDAAARAVVREGAPRRLALHR